MSKRTWMIGIDLHTEQPQICYFEQTTKRSGVMPMRVGNAEVRLSELFERPDQLSGGASAHTIADLLREVFRTFGIQDASREVDGLMITVATLDKPMVELIRAVYEDLGLARGSAFVQDYCESMFYYMTSQGKELWGRNTALFFFEDDTVTYYQLSVRDHVRPRAVRVTRGATCALEQDPQARDAALAQFAAEQLGTELFSSIFLAGRGFDASWADLTSRVLCRGGRKVFTEEGIFARGARNAVRERLGDRKNRGVVYESTSLISFDIGIELRVGETVGYHPLITGGAHWYNAQGECELLLGDEPSLTFILSGTTNGGRVRTVMPLDGVPERPEGTTRLHVALEFETPEKCTVTVTDLGFGEIFPASGQVWKETLGENR